MFVRVKPFVHGYDPTVEESYESVPVISLISDAGLSSRPEKYLFLRDFEIGRHVWRKIKIDYRFK